MKLTYKTTALLAASLLSSCYINSTGYALSNHSYEAVSVVSNSDSDYHSKKVYVRDGHYYLDLNAFRAKQSVHQSYGLGTEMAYNPKKKCFTDCANAFSLPYEDCCQMMEIPADFATYLVTGKGPNKPDWLKKAESVKVDDCKDYGLINHMPDSGEPAVRVNYDYTRPGYGTRIVLAPFQWLLFDLPMSTVGTAMSFAYMSPLLLLADPKSFTHDIEYAEQEYQRRTEARKDRLALEQAQQQAEYKRQNRAPHTVSGKRFEYKTQYVKDCFPAFSGNAVNFRLVHESGLFATGATVTVTYRRTGGKSAEVRIMTNRSPRPTVLNLHFYNGRDNCGEIEGVDFLGRHLRGSFYLE